MQPNCQARNIGAQMLADYMRLTNPELVFAHTRNPAILRLLAAACGGEEAVYPLNNSRQHAELALQIPGASVESDGVVYHVNRYGNTGLYGMSDPAERQFGASASLKERFPGLNEVGTALVVIAEPQRMEAQL
ncbi:MAG TPA: hypothetical protein VLH84_04745 [Patescibacteria group bacterium]|nr:hypothetical protein [Patescibacteria group bacterium]